MKEITKNTYYKNTYLYEHYFFKDIAITSIKKSRDISKNDYIFYVKYLNKYYKVNNINELLLFFYNNGIDYIKYDFELNELEEIKKTQGGQN